MSNKRLQQFHFTRKEILKNVLDIKKHFRHGKDPDGPIKIKKTTHSLTKEITLSNCFEAESANSQKKNINENFGIPSKPEKFDSKISDTICNTSSIKLRESEIPLLNKRLNLFPAMKEPANKQPLDNLYFFCRKIKLKKYFYNVDTSTNGLQQEGSYNLNHRTSTSFIRLKP